jgi:redox-sensitive bicupin YhaK (pirin superfamily)
VTIHQDARLYASILQNDSSIVHPLAPGRTAYVHLIRGQMTVNGQRLVTGDALKITGENNVTVDQAEAAEFLLFDLPY